MSEAAQALAVAEAKHEQAKAANPAHSASARANAGSGKTKVLIDRVARLLLRRPDGRPGASPDSILCITYTRAAASEMLTRLFEALGRWAVMEDGDLRAQLADLEGRKAADYTQDQLRAARALFARALETPGGLRIETIHAFCARILRRFPLEAGVVPGFAELEEDDARVLWLEAKRAAILEASGADPEALDLIAREAGRDGAMSALDALKSAGGSIRTFATSHEFDLARMDAALKQIIRPPPETPAALLARSMGPDLPAADIRRAIGVLGGGKKTDVAIAERLAKVLDCADPREALDLYLPVFYKSDGDIRTSPPFTKDMGKGAPFLHELFGAGETEGVETRRIPAVVEELKRADAYARTSALLRVGVPALEAYEAAKARRGALDFDDLIERTRDLLRTDGMSSWVLYKLDGGLTHLLLDEAQDTSPAQWELVDALTLEFYAGEGRERLQDPRTVFMVGDEKQSIYAFQGADPARFLEETRKLSARETKTIEADMRMSFRSSPEVLKFVDTVWNTAPVIDVPFAPQRPVTADEIVHTARRWNEPGLVELWPIAPKAAEPETDAWARPVDALRQSSPKAALAQSVAKAVQRMLSGEASVWAPGGVRRRAEAGDILILVRERRGGLFEAIIRALKGLGVPVAGADRLQLADYIGVQDCLNLMRFALLPSRDLTLAEILRGPFCGLVDDDRYLFTLGAGRQPGETLWTRVLASEDGEVIRVRRFLERLIANAALAPYEFLSSVLDVPQGGGVTGWEMLNARLGTPARDPVEALLWRALTHDASGPSSLQAFVAAMEATPVEIKRDLAKAGQEVRVMTVHGAKGLQAPIVILPDTTSKPKSPGQTIFSEDGGVVWAPRKDDDVAASARARLIAEAKALEEHRRLLYVALTRAQDRLLIAGYWYKGTGKNATGYDPGSWYALCEAAMGHLPATKLDDGMIRYGEPAPGSADSPARAGTALALPKWALCAPQPDPAARTLTAPTSLLGPKTRVVAPFDPKREARMRRGRLIHSLLQYLPDLPIDSREAAGAAFLARETELTKTQRSEMLRSAMGILQTPDFAELFEPGGRAEAAIIGTSDRLAPGLVVNGRVDRLVVRPDRVLVIDFKTDQPAPNDISGVAPGYVAQMAAYWAILQTAFPRRPVQALLCWTDGPQLMRIPEEMLSDSLNTVMRPV